MKRVFILIILVNIFFVAYKFGACTKVIKGHNTTNSLKNNIIKNTLKIEQYSVTAFPNIFEKAFFAGTTEKVENENIAFEAIKIGDINIESGRIIACDPIVSHDAVAFIHKFPIGKFPVELAIVNFGNDKRVAFSQISFSHNPVKKWEYALRPGQKELDIRDTTSFYGYGVDGGIGMFVDEQSNIAFNKNRLKLWEHVFIEEMRKTYENTYSYILYEFNNHNLASFSTGYGDGTYGTFIGYDKDGQVCRLLSDFSIIPWWENKQ